MALSDHHVAVSNKTVTFKIHRPVRPRSELGRVLGFGRLRYDRAGFQTTLFVGQIDRQELLPSFSMGHHLLSGLGVGS